MHGGQWGKTNIPPQLLQWVESSTTINDIITGSELYYVGLGDSMGHHMKGDIGVFLQGARNCKLFDIVINSMHNLSTMGVEFSDDASSVQLDPPVPQNSYKKSPGTYRGGSNHGVALVACEIVGIVNIEISDMAARSGISNAILCHGECLNMSITGCKFTSIVCGKPSNQGNLPNPPITCNYINIESVSNPDEISINI